MERVKVENYNARCVIVRMDTYLFIVIVMRGTRRALKKLDKSKTKLHTRQRLKMWRNTFLKRLKHYYLSIPHTFL